MATSLKTLNRNLFTFICCLIGPAIIFCTIVALANGGVIQNMKRSEVAEYQAGNVNSTSDPSQSAISDAAGDAPVVATDPKGDDAKSLEGEVDEEANKKLSEVDFFDEAAGLPSPPFKRNIVETLTNPSRTARAADRKRFGGSQSSLPQEGLESGKAGEKVEKLGNTSRAVRQIPSSRYTIRIPYITPENCQSNYCAPSAQCSVPTIPACPSPLPDCHTIRIPYITPENCPSNYCAPSVPCSVPTIPACPTPPPDCPTPPPACPTPPPACPTPPPVCLPGVAPPTFYPLAGRDQSRDTFTPGNAGVNRIRISDPRATQSRVSESQQVFNKRTSGFESTDPRNKSVQRQNDRARAKAADTRSTGLKHREFAMARGGIFDDPAARTSPTRRTTGVLKNSGNGIGGNRVCSSINALSGSSCTDRCSQQSACMISDSGNGRGGNKVRSCINYINRGNLLCNSGQGEGGNDVRSFCNIIGGDGASLVEGSNGAVLQSLLNMVIGQNCSIFGCNCHCEDDESSEEDDPCCSDPTTPRPCQPTPPTEYPPCIVLPGNAFLYENKKK